MHPRPASGHRSLQGGQRRRRRRAHADQLLRVGQTRGHASLCPPYARYSPFAYVACSTRFVRSPRPANRPATEISSSISSQWRSTRLSSTRWRCSGVAFSSRGNHAIGTPSVRPSVTVDPHRVFVEADVSRRNTHSTPSGYVSDLRPPPA
jgi:hypothetical protein